MIENAGCIYRRIRRGGFIALLTHLIVDGRSPNLYVWATASSLRRSNKGRQFAHPHLQYNWTKNIRISWIFHPSLKIESHLEIFHKCNILHTKPSIVILYTYALPTSWYYWGFKGSLYTLLPLVANFQIYNS